jgi:hypothetical protein
LTFEIVTRILYKSLFKGEKYMRIILPTLNMEGSYDLDPDTIDKKIEEERLGNYALGYLNEKNSFIVKYVGRGIVYDRLYEHLTDEHNQPTFKFSYAKAETDAKVEIEICSKECKNYHDFYYTKDGKKQLTNKEHPKLPKGKKCPYCSHVGGKE